MVNTFEMIKPNYIALFTVLRIVRGNEKRGRQEMSYILNHPCPIFDFKFET